MPNDLTVHEFYENQSSWDLSMKDVDIWTRAEVEKMMEDFAEIKCNELRRKFRDRVRRYCPLYLQRILLRGVL